MEVYTSRSAFRELTDIELEMVSGGDGGDEAIVVTGGGGGGGGGTGGGGAGWTGGGGDGGIGSGGGGGGGGGDPPPNDDVDGDGQPDPDIVVTTPPMTPQQQLAYDIALSRATSEIWLLGALGVGALTYLGAGSKLAAVLAAETGYVIGTALSAEDIARLTEALAEAYYQDDGADGVWDGVSDADRAAPYPYGGGGGGGGSPAPLP